MKLDLSIVMRLYKLLLILHLIASYGQSTRVQNAKESILKEIHHVLSFDGDDAGDISELKKSRTFNVIHHNNRHHHNRYSARKRVGPLFTTWSGWSECDTNCRKRRERYCKIKRKCGYTRHIEEQMCQKKNCKKRYTNIFKNQLNVEPDQFYQQTSLTTDLHPINKYSKSHPKLDDDYAQPILSSKQRHYKYHKVKCQHKEKHNHHKLPVYQEIENDDLADDSNGDDFFVIKKRRHPRKYLKKRKPILIEVDDYEDLENESNDDDNDGDIVFNTKFEKSIHHSKEWNRRMDPNENIQKKWKNLNLPTELDDLQYDNIEDNRNNDPDQEQLQLNNNTPYDYDNDYEESNDRNITQTTQLQPIRERAVYEAPPRRRRVYSKWSEWTKCSVKCTTRRYKKCRQRDVCGKEVLREIAYCYTEGSFCQQWLQSQVQKNSSPYDMRPLQPANRRKDDINSNTIANDYIMSGKGYRGPEYTPLKLRCGIPALRNNRRNMYNMLKIIGGKASRKGEWPWQVVIFNRFKEAFCGGTLIAPHWIVTAAHCVRKVLYVRLAEHNLDFEDGTEVEYRVMRSIKHPSYDKRTVDSDIALLKLPRPVNISTWIGFSCLPRPYQKLPRSIQCTVIGWGKRRNRDQAGTSILHQAEVPIIPMDNCKSVYYDYTITNNMFCAGHKKGRIDTCAGDSGGPLLCRDSTKPNHPWTIFGITSFGDGCAKRNKFGIYTKVPNYVDWIWSVINCNGNCKPNINNINSASPQKRI